MAIAAFAGVSLWVFALGSPLSGWALAFAGLAWAYLGPLEWWLLFRQEYMFNVLFPKAWAVALPALYAIPSVVILSRATCCRGK